MVNLCATMAHLRTIFGTFVYPVSYGRNLCTLSTKNCTVAKRFSAQFVVSENGFVSFSAQIAFNQSGTMARECFTLFFNDSQVQCITY